MSFEQTNGRIAANPTFEGLPQSEVPHVTASHTWRLRAQQAFKTIQTLTIESVFARVAAGGHTEL